MIKSEDLFFPLIMLQFDLISTGLLQDVSLESVKSLRILCIQTIKHTHECESLECIHPVFSKLWPSLIRIVQ